MTPPRSSLTTPGSDPEMMAKAAGYGADQVTLDLEDGVAEDEKARARGAVVDALCDLDWSGTTVAVRPNALEHPAGPRDVVEVAERAGDVLDLLVVPKVRRPGDVHAVATLLDQVEAGSERPGDGRDGIGVTVIVEEVEALQRIDEVLGASARVRSVALGFGDYAASQGMNVSTIGGTTDYPGDIWHYPRVRTVVAARANGLYAMEGPYADYNDPDGLRDACHLARAVGFDGKGTIHPAQIPIVNEVFGADRGAGDWGVAPSGRR